MTIAKQFFTTLINTARHTDDAKALRAHMNAVNARHFGNGLKPAKLFAYFADMMGTANANKLTALLDDELSKRSTDTVEKLNAALTPMMSVVADFGNAGRVVGRQEPISHWLMSVPFLTIKTTGSNDDPECDTYHLGVDLWVEYAKASNIVLVDATLRLYDTEMNAYDLSYDMEILTPEDLLRYFSDDLEMGFGEIKDITLHEGVLRFFPVAPTLQYSSPLLSFLIYGLCQHLLGEISGVCSLSVKDVDRATHQFFYASGEAHKSELSSQ